MTRIDPMIETIRSIILDFQETRLETGVPRRLRIETVHGKAAVCIGVRRSGKSTYMFQVIRRLLDGGVPRQNILSRETLSLLPPGITAENRPTSHVRLPCMGSRSYVLNEQLTRLTPFSQIYQPGLSWRTKDAKGAKINQVIKTLLTAI